MQKTIDFAAMYSLRKDGRYQGFYYDQNHKRCSVCDKDPERLYQRICAKSAEAAKPRILLFKDIAGAWHRDAEKTLKPGTWACYDSHYDRAMETLGESVAADISTPDVRALLQKMANQGLSHKSCHNQRIVISSIYKFAMQDQRFADLIKFNPAANAQIPRNAKKAVEREAPEDDVVQRIRESAIRVPFGTFALFLISTGTRRGEALAVKWKDVDFEKKTIKITGSVNYHATPPAVTETKTTAGVRTIPLLPDLEMALLALPDHEKDGFLFYASDPNKLMAETTYKRHWYNYCVAMGFVDKAEESIIKNGKAEIKTIYKPNLTPHLLRHGYATLLFEAGVDVYTAKRLLGHADIETTMGIYTHLRKAQEEKSVGLLINQVQKAMNGTLEYP